jgi:hypothetical protein
MTGPSWFRCYLPPCGGDRRTDTTWKRHYAAAHHGTAAQAVERSGKTDLLPAPSSWQDGSSALSGRAAFLAEREVMRQTRTP